VSSQRAFSGRIVVQMDGSGGLEASEVDCIALGGAPRLATPGSRLDHVPQQTAELTPRRKMWNSALSLRSSPGIFLPIASGHLTSMANTVSMPAAAASRHRRTTYT